MPCTRSYTTLRSYNCLLPTCQCKLSMAKNPHVHTCCLSQDTPTVAEIRVLLRDEEVASGDTTVPLLNYFYNSLIDDSANNKKKYYKLHVKGTNMTAREQIKPDHGHQDAKPVLATLLTSLTTPSKPDHQERWNALPEPVKQALDRLLVKCKTQAPGTD